MIVDCPEGEEGEGVQTVEASTAVLIPLGRVQSQQVEAKSPLSLVLPSDVERLNLEISWCRTSNLLGFPDPHLSDPVR